jgi:hypothetical protein
MLKAASELGFTPVSRPRVDAGPSPPAPDFGDDAGEKGRGKFGKRHMSLDEYLASAPKMPTVN